MGTSNPGILTIYLLTGIESTHGCGFRCLVTLHQPIRVEKPPAFSSTSSNFNASKLLSSLIEIITHKTLKSPRHECDIRVRRHFVPFVYNKTKAGGLFLE